MTKSVKDQIRAGTASIVYEQPITERIRNFLRLEHLFQNINYAIANPSAWGSREAIVTILELVDLLSRTDFKAELIKELERHAAVLLALANKPGVDGSKLSDVTSRIEKVANRMKVAECQPTQRVRTDEFLNQVKQRVAIPGGACNFDLPALHYWLSQPMHKRVAELNTWMEDLRVIESAIDLVLMDIRQSTIPLAVTASGGFFQQNIDASSPVLLLRVVLPADIAIFPEISGGKHRFTVRMMRQASSRERPEQVECDVDFQLQCCGI